MQREAGENIFLPSHFYFSLILASKKSEKGFTNTRLSLHPERAAAVAAAVVVMVSEEEGRKPDKRTKWKVRSILNIFSFLQARFSFSRSLLLSAQKRNVFQVEKRTSTKAEEENEKKIRGKSHPLCLACLREILFFIYFFYFLHLSPHPERQRRRE
jgi:hypothetical protein